MELRHLKYFLTLSEELSFTKAAEKLFISQPPLSRQIMELEKEIGTPLFDRTNKKVKLTEAGKYFQSQVQNIFFDIEHIKLKTKEIGNSINGVYKIAYISSTFSGDISHLVKYLSDKYPNVKFRLYEFTTTMQIEALEQGKIDLGIVRAPIYSSKIDTKLWFSDSYSIICHEDSPISNDKKSLEQLKNETFVFFNKDYAPAYYSSLMEICASIGFTPKVVHESNNVSSIIQMVSNGLGVSIVPSNVLKNKNFVNIKSIEIKDSRFYTDVLLAKPKGLTKDITNDILDFLKNKY